MGPQPAHSSHNPSHLVSLAPKCDRNALWFESKLAHGPICGVCREPLLGPGPLAQLAFPPARLSQGQMTSFSMAWSPDSPVPASSESIRQVPLCVGTSILIWKKLQAQKESMCMGTGRIPNPHLTLTSPEKADTPVYLPKALCAANGSVDLFYWREQGTHIFLRN